MNSKYLPTLGSFVLICSVWQGRKPSPDSDGGIGSAQETMPALFQQLFGCDSQTSALQRYHDKARPEPTITRWFCVRVMWELDSLEFNVAETRPHNNSPPSFGQGKQSSPPCRC